MCMSYLVVSTKGLNNVKKAVQIQVFTSKGWHPIDWGS